MARAEFDDYPTPSWTVDRLLDRCLGILPTGGGRWLEPTAGGGNIIRAVNAYLEKIQADTPNWCAVEIQRKYHASLAPLCERVSIGSFISLARTTAVRHPPRYARTARGPGRRPYDVSIGNPPFKLAQEVIERCVDLSWWTVMLLRLNFLASEERHEFYKKVGMPDTYVLPNRPSFKGENPTDTDMQEYAWYVWPPGQPRDYGNMYRLELTPLEERVAR